MSPGRDDPRDRRRRFPRVSGDEPWIADAWRERIRFPRVSGDEPREARTLGLSTMFSPRERG